MVFRREMARTSSPTTGKGNQPQLSTDVLERVVVIGTSCAGKTSFARRLSDALEVPIIELDAIHWLPDWVPRPTKEFQSLAGQAVAADGWVADGNYGRVRDIVWPRATCLIWLNYPFRVVFWRALRRTLARVFTRQAVYSGNTESFRRGFLSKDSILWWVITTFRRRRREIPLLFAKPEFSHLRVYEFKSQRDTDDFMQGLG